MSMRTTVRSFLLLAAALGAGIAGAADKAFRLQEATIEDVHGAIRSGEVTCKGLVEAYVARATAPAFGPVTGEPK